MSDFDPHNAFNLKTLFDISRQIPPAETLEQIRQNYFIAATMKGDDAPSIGGLNINMSGRKDAASLNNDKKKRHKDDTALLLMISNMSIEQMENRLAAQYGENFAENLAAEFLDEETYKRLMEIEDQTERRRQIAFELNKAIESGSIDADEVYRNSDFKDWLDTHKVERQHKLKKTEEAELDQENTNGLPSGTEKAEQTYQGTQNANLETGLDFILGK